MLDDCTIERLSKVAIAMKKRAYKPKGVDEELEGCVILDERGITHRGCTIHYNYNHLLIEAVSVSIASMIASGARQIVAVCMTDNNPSLDALLRIQEFSNEDTLVYRVNENVEEDDDNRLALIDLHKRIHYYQSIIPH